MRLLLLDGLFRQKWASQSDVTQKGLALIHSDNVTDTYAHTFSINMDYFFFFFSLARFFKEVT